MPLGRRTERLLHELKNLFIVESLEIRDWSLQRAFYADEDEYEFAEGTETVSPGHLQSRIRETLFLKKTLDIPEIWRGKATGIMFKAGGEGLLSVNGVPYHGLDKNRSYIPLSAGLAASATLDLHVELYHVPPLPVDPLNGQVDHVPPPVDFQDARLVILNKRAESLYFTVKLCHDTAILLPAGGIERSRLETALEAALAFLSGQDAAGRPFLADEARLVEAEERLTADLNASRAGQPPGIAGTMHMVGQSHIDLAWLWPLKETVRKASRTFSTVITLMEQYEHYRYSQSQPQLYDYVKRHDPELYASIKKRIAEGRWELVGGMWVEPDLNIPSGESLVRQLLYGRAFYDREFGKNSRVEWLPDTFGYCASLPQLLKKSGVDYFMTTKMNWNDTNRFPYDLFYWQGIDGTKVLSYLNHGLNEDTAPADVSEHWNSFRQKKVHPEQMLLYGYGDGGGGVTREMLETVERSGSLPGLPGSRFSTAHEFFDGIRDAAPPLPVWSGDMYLELHRGTYTTHGQNKRWNRKAEALYRETEIWNTLSYLSGAAELAECASTQHGELQEGWNLLLLNQFHDIIPGTSIPEVYVKSKSHYEEIFGRGERVRAAVLNRLEKSIDTQGEGIPVILFNSLSWERRDAAALTGGKELTGLLPYDDQGVLLPSDLLPYKDGYAMYISAGTVPSMGYRTVWLRPEPSAGSCSHAGGQAAGTLEQAEERALPVSVPEQWETAHYRLAFDTEGRIVSWLDKSCGRELVEAGGAANHLQLFHDRPTVWDAWDIDPHFGEQPAAEAVLLSSEVLLQGQTRDVLRMSWQLNHSLIEQQIIFHRDSRRVDFETRVDWREEHKLLKAAFPVQILSSKAVYEIPFGSIERPTHTNTSWEQAQLEVCGHRWADLSEGGYGVSLLNDCKYGYDIKGNTLRLSLLRAPRWPDSSTDIGIHEFTYSLLPHQGDWREGGVVREGFVLNQPLYAHIAEAHDGVMPSSRSLLELKGNHTIIDALKMAEDASGAVIRMYESGGGRENVLLTLPGNSQVPDGRFTVEETNLMEQPEAAQGIEVEEEGISRTFTPYEVVTLRVGQE
ncbi:alpha-mannosidase [Paenibacillus sp. PK3_47]|uniref:alpha-mannosidase n=1 Tax=Paenibacillus sp. PK3_47 TaxID=2072642 RepID=UPI00201DBD68|nr:alpha-mannosidase [Paenibacillus sp. PK3_47]UQZ36764.1 alpha-mannosidase [Paenibacillus sp. PK3_47]